jgi:polyisoprenoid-binding protein YceI
MKRTFLLLAVLALCLSQSAFAEKWKVDPAHSSIAFSVTHLMIAKVHGSFGQFEGTAEFDPKDLSTMKADFTVQSSSISTNNDRRDGHLKSDDFLNVEQFPTMMFKSKKAEVVGDGHVKLTGDLTIRDITKEVTFDVRGFNAKVKMGDGFKTAGVATTTIDRFDFGTKWSSKMESGDLIAGKDVNIEVNVEFDEVQ